MISYAELEEASTGYANLLGHLGVGQDDRVILSVERSLATPALLLAILKAGASYVPLDPFDPPSRLLQLVNDCQPKLLIGETSEARQQATLAGCLYAEAPEFDDLPVIKTSSVTYQRRPASVACFMYTSGSTGFPKAVMVTHLGVVDLARGSRALGVTSRDIFLQLAPLAFDASTFEIWGPLLNGASVYIAPRAVITAQDVGAVISKSQATIVWLTAALFHRQVDECISSLAGPRTVLSGGDVVSVAHVNKYLRAHPGKTFINGYGPTETTTFACLQLLHEPVHSLTVPIGSPMDNVAVVVVDKAGDSVEWGAVGELIIGGPGVARGYWKQASLSRIRFGTLAELRLAGSSWSNTRFYRSGDLVRGRPDGAFDFVGRIDDQIKLRGLRIEPGEVEATIQQVRGVSRAVVVLDRGSSNADRLIAYYVLDGTRILSASDLRASLRTELPLYMVPNLFVEVASLPLNSNGKLDRHALPRPDLSARATYGGD